LKLELPGRRYGCDVRVRAIGPVQEAFRVNYIADLQILDRGVDVGRRVAQI
jgi:hypothetical protein